MDYFFLLAWGGYIISSLPGYLGVVRGLLCWVEYYNWLIGDLLFMRIEVVLWSVILVCRIFVT